MRIPRAVKASFALSLLAHLLVFYLAATTSQTDLEDRIFRARLAYKPRFTPPPRLPAPSFDLPLTEMEFVRPPTNPQNLDDSALPLTAEPRPSVVTAPESQLAVAEPGTPPKAPTPQSTPEKMPAPTAGWVYGDSAESESMDLVRMEDLSRADGERAAIIQDLSSRRDLRGYINFTLLRLDGAGSRGPGGKILTDLSRYLRDYTQILARVRDQYHTYFLSPQLLKDPIHFLFPNPRLGGGDELTYLSDDELDHLARYLRGGGFLYIESDTSTAGMLWIKEMIVHLHQALQPEGRLVEIPFSHPIYHAYYDFDQGFPGDRKRLLSVPIPNWYFRRGYKDRQGLWGVELDGELVAIISDIDLATQWSAANNALISLRAATNIVAYALTRPGGLTKKRLPPAWKESRPQTPLAMFSAPPEEAFEQIDLTTTLDASLALVHASLDHKFEDGLRLRLDGQYNLEWLKGGMHGLLLRNLPAGRHWIEVEYGGKTAQLEVDLPGGQVRTVALDLDHLLFFSRLRLRQQKEVVDLQTWRNRFSDLTVDEVSPADEMEGLAEP